MRKDSRLSRVLHVLVHLERHEGAMTSAQIAEMLSTNPVVVRRIMGLLRESGYVQSAKGRDGGWSLARPLRDITLLDIHNAFGESSLFTIGLIDEHSNCLIEKSINVALQSVMEDAEILIKKRFSEVTLDMLNK